MLVIYQLQVLSFLQLIAMLKVHPVRGIKIRSGMCTIHPQFPKSACPKCNPKIGPKTAEYAIHI